MPNGMENSDVNLTFLISDANQFAHHVLVRYDCHDASVCEKSGLCEALQLKYCWELHLQNTPEFCIVQQHFWNIPAVWPASHDEDLSWGDWVHKCVLPAKKRMAKLNDPLARIIQIEDLHGSKSVSLVLIDPTEYIQLVVEYAATVRRPANLHWRHLFWCLCFNVELCDLVAWRWLAVGYTSWEVDFLVSEVLSWD